MEWIDIATLTVRREFRPGTYKKLSGEIEPCFDLHRDCGLGCTCSASVWFRDGAPTIEAAENKCLCFNDRNKQGVSEVKGTGRAIKEGPDEWIYEVQAKLTEARHNDGSNRTPREADSPENDGCRRSG